MEIQTMEILPGWVVASHVSQPGPIPLPAQGSHGAWVCVEPFLHVDLKSVFGMLVLEDVGYLSCAPVIRSGGSVDWLRRASGDAERVPE